MPAQIDFSSVFHDLKQILTSYSPLLTITANTDQAYSLEAAYSEKWKKNLFFASVQIKKNYVSFYLMPVYMYPSLLKNLSPELKKHMQGKSCFNFKKKEKSLFDELKDLTQQGFELMMKEEYS